MKYTIVVGSHRKQSQSSKVGNYLAAEMKKAGGEVTIINFGTDPIPLWSEDKWEGKGEITKVWTPLSAQLKSSDAFIIISPEWNGQVPAALMNFFLCCDKQELSHKPALIVTVSAGRGGAYPVAELRMAGYKNTQICYMPEHIIVRNVKEVLNTPELDENNKADAYIKKRIAHALPLLEEYAKAFQQIRAANKHNYKTYGFGM